MELDWESRKYIRIRINQISKTKDEEGVVAESNKYFPVSRCNQSNFESTSYERNFFERNKEKFFYCPEQPREIFLEGVRGNQESTYFVYEVLKCQDRFRARSEEKVDEACQDGSNRECPRKYL